MTIELAGLLALVIGIIGFFRPQSFIVRVFLYATLLGAAAAFSLEFLGGASITPAHLLLGFVLIRLFAEPNFSDSFADAFQVGRPGFWLLVTVVYSVISAYFLPRLFEGQTLVFAIRSQAAGYMTPLAPASSNLTQSVYYVADLICFVLFYGYASTTEGGRVLGNAALACATLNLIFAALDLLTFFTNTTELLSPIRNANYQMLVGTEVVGFKRIVGSFVEASSFAAMTLGYFAFTSRLWLLGVLPMRTGTLAALSFVALIFSTSTTAYVGVTVVVLLCYAEMLIRMMRGPVTRQVGLFVVATPIIVAVVFIVVALNENYSAFVLNLLEPLLFNKLSTDSGVERAMMNASAIQSFFDTYGLGVGNGSVLASSFLVGVPASLGVIGALTFSIFFLLLFLIPCRFSEIDPLDNAYRRAAKFACVAWLIANSTSATLIDLGLPFFAFAAFSCSSPKSVKTSTARLEEESWGARSLRA